MNLTKANVKKLGYLIKFKPNASLDEGIKKFIKWYHDFSAKNIPNL